jgi:hypothetical protein
MDDVMWLYACTATAKSCQETVCFYISTLASHTSEPPTGGLVLGSGRGLLGRNL